MAKKKEAQGAGNAPRIRNKKARFNYTLHDRYEAGLELLGSEVKSLRQGKASLAESYATVRQGQAFLVGANIPEYENAGYAGHEPTRQRKLLMHRREIEKIGAAIDRKGVTLVPLAIYFKRGWAKIELALATGKQQFDKRDSIRKRETEREISRAMTRRR